MGRKVLGLKLSGPRKEGSHISPGAIGWALVDENEGSLIGVSSEKALREARGVIGIYLRDIRESKGITIDVLAKAVGVESENISSIEAGTIGFPFDLFLKIVNALDCFFYLKDRNGKHLNAQALRDNI